VSAGEPARDVPPGVSGSCLCGGVRYQAGPPVGPMGHCHCATCRKAHGAAFSTTVRVARAGFGWTSGEELLSSFESSPGKRRTFCRVCGSQLIAAWDHEDQIILRAGCIDGDPGVRPVVHIWTSDAAPWYVIADGLPQLPEGVIRRTPRDPEARGAGGS
jgi:hypothetical protein